MRVEPFLRQRVGHMLLKVHAPQSMGPLNEQPSFPLMDRGGNERSARLRAHVSQMGCLARDPHQTPPELATICPELP